MTSTCTLRIGRTQGLELRAATRRHRFAVGRPIEFDIESPTISALEYAVGAVGAEIVGGLLAFAKRRRLTVDDVEAVVTGEVEHALAYLEVVGEPGPPRITRLHARVYAASPDEEASIRRAFDEALTNLPLVCTLRATTRVDVELVLTA